jgi:hypothetical protein
MTANHSPESQRYTPNPVWLIVRQRDKTHSFELAPWSHRCVVVGSCADADVRVETDAPVAFYLERQEDGVLLTPAYVDSTLRVDARKVTRPQLVQGQALVEFSGLQMQLQISPFPPMQSSARQFENGTTAEHVRVSDAYSLRQNRTALIPVEQAVTHEIPIAHTVELPAVQLGDPGTIERSRLVGGTQVIETVCATNEKMHLPSAERRIQNGNVRVSNDSSALTEQPASKGASGMAMDCAPTSIDPAPIVVLGGSGVHDSLKAAGAAMAQAAVAPLAGEDPVSLQVAEFDRVHQPPVLPFGQGKPVAATTVVEMPTSMPRAAGVETPTAGRMLTVVECSGESSRSLPLCCEGEASHGSRPSAVATLARLQGMARHHPIGVAAGAIVGILVLGVLGVGTAQIVRSCSSTNPVDKSPAAVVSPLLTASIEPAPAGAVERPGASADSVNKQLPTTGARDSNTGVVAGASPDENPNLAVGHLFSGRLPEAEQAYRELSQRHPEDQTYLTAVRLLARRNGPECRVATPAQAGCPMVKQ